MSPGIPGMRVWTASVVVATALLLAASSFAQSTDPDCADPNQTDPLAELVADNARAQATAGSGASTDSLGALVGDLQEAFEKSGVGETFGLPVGNNGLVHRDTALSALADGTLSFPQLKQLHDRGKISSADFAMINLLLHTTPDDYRRGPEREPVPFETRPKIVAGDPAYPVVRDIEIAPGGLRMLAQAPDGTLRLSLYGKDLVPAHQSVAVKGAVTAATLTRISGNASADLVVESRTGGQRTVTVFETGDDGRIGTPAHVIQATDDTDYRDLAIDEYLFADLLASPAPAAAEPSTEQVAFEDVVQVQEIVLKRRFGGQAELHFVDYGNDHVPDAFVRTADGVYFVRSGDLSRTLAFESEADVALGSSLAVGDLNGDRIPDFAFTAKPTGAPEAVWIFYGRK